MKHISCRYPNLLVKLWYVNLCKNALAIHVVSKHTLNYMSYMILYDFISSLQLLSGSLVCHHPTWMKRRSEILVHTVTILPPIMCDSKNRDSSWRHSWRFMVSLEDSLRVWNTRRLLGGKFKISNMFDFCPQPTTLFCRIVVNRRKSWPIVVNRAS
jgi:hypothetical protein